MGISIVDGLLCPNPLQRYAFRVYWPNIEALNRRCGHKSQSCAYAVIKKKTSDGLLSEVWIIGVYVDCQSFSTNLR